MLRSVRPLEATRIIYVGPPRAHCRGPVGLSHGGDRSQRVAALSRGHNFFGDLKDALYERLLDMLIHTLEATPVVAVSFADAV